MQKILLVDDEPDILELLSYSLKKEGYQLFTASNGLDGVRIAKEVLPDLIVMDIMMPKMDGIEACRILRSLPQFSSTHILFLTARNEEYTEIAGFDAGANDFINKPVKTRALASRIHAVLKRNTAGADEGANQKLEIGNLIIDRETYLVYQNKTEISLARKEFELLYLLASKPNKVFTRDAILKNVWEEFVVVSNRTIDVHVRKIREKIGEQYLTTVKGVGYKFTP